MMTRTTWRLVRTELLRSAAPAAGVTSFALGALMMYSEANSWAGRWMPFAASARFSMLVLAPIAVAFGAWHGGRDRRRRIDEQVTVSARPQWQPLLVGWAGITLGCWVGLLLIVGAGAALVAPVATYAGGGWWWLLAVAFVSLAAMTAVGVALGRVVSFWLVAPVAAIALYGLQVYAHDDAGELHGAEWLVPIVPVYQAFAQTLGGRVHLHQALWFSGLAATALVLVGARRRWAAVLPLAVAVAGAAPLLSNPSDPRWEFDADATELVCTADEPEVCLPRLDAFVLDDVTPVARQVLSRLEGVPGGPTRAVGSAYGPGGDESALYVDTGWITLGGDLHPEEDWTVVQWSLSFACDLPELYDQYYWVVDTASTWATGHDEWAEPPVRAALEELDGMPEADQKAWIGAVIRAAESCDEVMLAELAGQLA